jgi:hypothetical protein
VARSSRSGRSAQSGSARQSHTAGATGSPWASNGPSARSATSIGSRSRAPPSSAATTSSAARRLAHAERPVGHRGLVLRAVRQCDEHVPVRPQVGALHRVEGDDRQRRERGRAAHLGVAGEPAQHEEVGFFGRFGAGQADELELAVELDAVLVIAGDDQRPAAAGTDVGRDPGGDLGVARDHPQHRPVVAGGVVAARLVVARHARPRRHGGDQGQPCRGRRLDHLGDVRGAERAQQRDRARIARRGLGTGHRVAVAVGGVRHPGRLEHVRGRARERLRQGRMDPEAVGHSALAAARAATRSGS